MIQVDLTIMVLYMATVITMIAVPGPVLALVTGAGLTGGPKWALRTVVGADLASLVLILLSVLIIKGLFAVNETAFNLLKFIGACYIAYTGWNILNQRSDFNDHAPAAIQMRLGGFSQGFLTSISNPKDIIFFASFFPLFLNITANADASIVLLTILWIILDIAILMLVYLLVSNVVVPSAHRVILTISGIFMLIIAFGSLVIVAIEMMKIQI